MKPAQISPDKTDIKKNNIINILEVIRRPGTHSRREIQKLTGLSWGAVSTITAGLLEKGYIADTGEKETALGRKPSALDINYEDNFIIGIDLNILGLTVTVSDIKGRIKNENTKILQRSDKIYILNELTKILDSIILRDFRDKNLLCIGIAAQGPVDMETGVSIFSPHFTKWENVNICEMLFKRYSIRAFIFHDPDCVLLAERLFSDYDTQNPVLIRLDKGIGMSAVVSGGAFLGARGHSSELGHVTIDANGPQCDCGKKGCFEVFATSTGIVRRFLEQAKQGARTSVRFNDPDSVTYMEIYEAANAGDELCQKIYRSAGFHIGMAIACVINLFGPDEIILYGCIAEIHDIYENIMNETIRENVFYASRLPVVRYSRLDKNAAALGGGLSAFSKYIRTEPLAFSHNKQGEKS